MAKILLVEDDQQFALMISEFLKFEHHLVETTASGMDESREIRTYHQRIDRLQSESKPWQSSIAAAQE